MNINTALMIVLSLILICVFTRVFVAAVDKSTTDGMKYGCRKYVTKEFPPEYPHDALLELHNAHINNTLTQRPGTTYNKTVHDDRGMAGPAFVIKLLYRPGCARHHLALLFEDIAKTMISDGTAETSNIEFQREIIDNTNPYNLLGGFPKIIKIRKDGQVLEYAGYTNYGQLYDWILNESLLY